VIEWYSRGRRRALWQVPVCQQSSDLTVSRAVCGAHATLQQGATQKAHRGICSARVHRLLAGLLLQRHATSGGRRRCGRLLLLELRDELHLLQHVRRHLRLHIAARLTLQPRQDRSVCLLLSCGICWKVLKCSLHVHPLHVSMQIECTEPFHRSIGSPLQRVPN
jgi:hypothetical protein